MQHVYILQCGYDVVFCSSAISVVYKSLVKRLTPEQASDVISYMSLTRLFHRDAVYFYAAPHGLTWAIKQLVVHKKSPTVKATIV